MRIIVTGKIHFYLPDEIDAEEEEDETVDQRDLRTAFFVFFVPCFILI